MYFDSSEEWDEVERTISARIRQAQIDRAVRRSLKRRRLKREAVSILSWFLPFAIAIAVIYAMLEN